MKYLFTLFFAASCLLGQAQTIVLPNGEYLDTTSVRTPPCPTYGVRYYSVQGKYPRSSSTLAKEAQAFLQRQQRQAYVGSGYVTFRFVIDCAGHRQPRVQVLQTDAQYQRSYFAKELIGALYAYFQTLTEWRIGKLQNGPVNYIAYLTFKIQDGKVVAVVP